MTDLLLESKAHKFAAAAHGLIGQVRAGGAPYIVHPEEVADTVRRWHARSPVVAAAYLHDVLEDVRFITEKTLYWLFGSEVTAIVVEVSTPDYEGMRRADRVAAEAARFEAISLEGQLVKAADILSNLRNLTTLKRSFAPLYVEEKAMQAQRLTKLPANVAEELKQGVSAAQQRVALLG